MAACCVVVASSCLAVPRIGRRVRSAVVGRVIGRGGDDWEGNFWGRSDVGNSDGNWEREGALSGRSDEDWASRAREKALQALRLRDPSFVSLDSLRRTRNKGRRKKGVGRGEDIFVGGRGVGNICWPPGQIEDVVADEGISSLAREDSERSLNKRLVQAGDCEEILTLVGDALARARNEGLQLLTPVNAATALHRIARHMETVAMSRSDRLGFARRQEMVQLVRVAVSVVRSCSARGVSNIAWALSKVGGSSLYADEMEVVGVAGLDRLCELQPQHIANVAGAYAAMRLANHSLFEGLAQRASLVAGRFQPQELAQLLWAFATLCHPVSPLLDALDLISEDCVCGNGAQSEDTPNPVSRPAHLKPDIVRQGPGMLDSFNLDHLAVISWAYSVLNELRRPSFARIWAKVSQVDHESQANKGVVALTVRSLSQLYQVKLTLDLEYPDVHLRLASCLEEATLAAWNKGKRGSLLTSALQKEIRHLLTGAGLQFEAEYTAAHYSVDLALVQRHIAVEIDGPSHFARNTGSPLGHTVLKTRHLKAAGWRVVSVPYHELEKLQGEKSHTKFVRELLQGCL